MEMLIGTHERAIEWAYLRPPRPKAGLKTPLVYCSQTPINRRKYQQSTFDKTFAGCECRPWKSKSYNFLGIRWRITIGPIGLSLDIGLSLGDVTIRSNRDSSSSLCVVLIEILAPWHRKSKFKWDHCRLAVSHIPTNWWAFLFLIGIRGLSLPFSAILLAHVWSEIGVLQTARLGDEDNYGSS